MEAEKQIGQPTFGQKAVGVNFNPSQDTKVDEIKRKAAELIDLCNNYRRENAGEPARYMSKAVSHFEDGCMNAVKAVTWVN